MKKKRKGRGARFSVPPTPQQPADAPAVCRCGAPANPRHKDRCRNGHPVKDNTISLIHGANSKRVMHAGLPEQAEVRAMLREKEAAIVADLGGAGNLSTIKREVVTRFLQTSVVADFLGSNIVKHGVLTTKGKTRAAVTTYLQVVDRLTRLALTLGLERQTKQVPTVEDFLRQRQQQPPQEPAS